MKDVAWALVTGASRGIGRAIALALADAGLDVVVGYQSNHDAAMAVVHGIAARQRKGYAARLPVHEPQTEALVQALIAEHGTPAVLVNNAGVAQDGLFALMGRDSWERVVDTNLGSFYTITRPVVRHMLKARAGRIISIASTAGQSGNPGQVHYSASKAGLIGATKALALELAPRGITVNAVSPGFIATDMVLDLPQEKIIAAIPMKRLGTAEDVAAAVAFLASPAAAYITGQVLAVNGGLYT